MSILFFLFMTLVDIAGLMILNGYFFDNSTPEKKTRNFYIGFIIVFVIDMVLFMAKGDWI